MLKLLCRFICMSILLPNSVFWVANFHVAVQTDTNSVRNHSDFLSKDYEHLLILPVAPIALVSSFCAKVGTANTASHPNVRVENDY